MTYADPFIQITFGGTTAAGNEIWSCGIKIGQRGTILPPLEWFANMSAKLPQVGALLATFVGASGSKVPATTKLTWAKMALIDVDGKYMEEAAEVQLNQFGYAADAYSPQDALVIGLVSDKWKDPGKNNRFYLPTVGPSGTNSWKLTATEQTAVLNTAKTLINGINALLNPTQPANSGVVCVISNAGTGYEIPAVEVRVGQVVDTQRRRRNKLDETYASMPITI